MKSLSRVSLCNPLDCSLPSSSVRGIFQARVLEWVAISFSRDLPNPGVEPRSPALQADCCLLNCKRQEQFLVKGGTATKSPQAGFKDQRSSPRLESGIFLLEPVPPVSRVGRQVLCR